MSVVVRLAGNRQSGDGSTGGRPSVDHRTGSGGRGRPEFGNVGDHASEPRDVVAAISLTGAPGTYQHGTAVANDDVVGSYRSMGHTETVESF